MMIVKSKSELDIGGHETCSPTYGVVPLQLYLSDARQNPKQRQNKTGLYSTEST